MVARREAEIVHKVMTAYALVQTEIYAACMNRRIAGPFTDQPNLSPRVPSKVCVPWAFETAQGSTNGGYRASGSVDMFPSSKGEAAHAGGRNSRRLQPGCGQRAREGWEVLGVCHSSSGGELPGNIINPPVAPRLPIPPLRAAKMNSQYRPECLIPA